MLEVLVAVEVALPDLLGDESAWTGLYAASERPALTRLWRQWGEYRVYLHAFEPCSAEEAFSHPHPWKFAIRILDGCYEMVVGMSADPTVVPTVSAKMLFEPGSCYEMTHPHGFHAIRPVGGPSHSLMVAGPVIWPENRARGNAPTRPLTGEERTGMFQYFHAWYPRR